MIKITAEEFKIIAKYIYDLSGITMEFDKAYLVETRLDSLLQEHKCETYSDLCSKARADSSGAINRKIVDAISTNETLFFRDTGPFDLLKNKIIPDLIDRKSEQNRGAKISIKIWSAACSTGQEVYSIAIILKEMLRDMSKYDIKILGTDISSAAVEAAKIGEYGKFEIERGLAQDKLQKYFISEEDSWKIKDEIKAMASFKTFNLFDDLAPLGKFDVIFCRNVAIYFSIEDRKVIFNKIADILEPKGSLIIGSSEYLTGICDRFLSQRHLKSVFYQLKDDDAASAEASAKTTLGVKVGVPASS